jgi:cbb3-type cytochrome oxidase subunit 1
MAADYRCSCSRHSPLGFSTAKEYAELEWPIDIAITIDMGGVWLEHVWYYH